MRIKYLLLLPILTCTAFAAQTPKTIDDIYAPTVVAVPPCDPVKGLIKMPDGKIRHSNYGGQPENQIESKYSFKVKNRMYIESADKGLTWSEHQLPAGVELPLFRHPANGRYFRVDGVNGQSWFFDYGTDGEKEVSRTEICPWWFEFNAEPCFVGKRILVPVTPRTSSCQQNVDFVFGSFFFITDDFGKTWSKSSRLNVPHHKAGGVHKGTRWNHDAMEPTAIALKDGRVWTVIRTSLDNLWQAWSKDGGFTWSKPVPTPFYGTCVMPKLGRLSDGKLLLMWANATALPELEGANGVWEDVFTNRSAIHAAISDDDGKTWRGFREILLDPRRNAPDFATSDDMDKSVHQSQFIEAAPNKIVAAIGQSKASRRIVLFDTRWLEETSRKCDFSNGLDDWSVFNYKKGIIGHCAYNRFEGCKTVPNPDAPTKNCLLIRYQKDDSLVSDIRGAVWNFPSADSGKIDLKIKCLRGFKGGKIMIHDRWINPSDESAETLSFAAFEIPESFGDGKTRSLELKFDAKNKTATLSADGEKIATRTINRPAPIGVSYLQLQSGKTDGDAGMLVLEVSESGAPRK